MPTTTALMPEGRQRYYNNDGTPAAGAKLYTYAAGTSAPKLTYADEAGTTPNPNPLTLDAKGEAVIFWAGAYKVDLKQADGQQVTGYPVDNLKTDPAGIWGVLASLAAAAGATLVGFIQAGVGAVRRTLQDRLRETIYAEDFDTLAHAVAAAAGKKLVLNHDYAVDNSTGPGLVLGTANMVVTGRGRLLFSNINQHGVLINAKDVRVRGITVQGPGSLSTVQGPPDSPALIFIDGTNATGPMNCEIRGVKVLEPGRMGIAAYKAVGFEIVKNIIESSQPVAAYLNTSNNHMVRAYSCARFEITGNRIKGGAEGIVTQAYDSTVYSFDDFDGIVGSKCRKFSITGNHVTSTYDHAIYVCNENEHFICSDNFLWSASAAEGGEGTCSLKLEGGHFVAQGNKVREGIQLRNPYFGRVEGNNVLIYSGRGTFANPSKMGILCQDVQFKRDLEGMAFNNNTVTVVGAQNVDAGIWIEGAVWDGYQSVIKDLSICNNTISGAGQSSAGNGFGILVHQDMPKDGGGNVTGATGQGVTISGNTISMSTFTAYPAGCGSAGIELLNIDVATVTGNTVRNFTQRGINLLGVRYSLVAGNTLVGNAASPSQRFGVFEDNTNLTLHVDGVQNSFGVNHMENVAYKYFPAHQSTVCLDKLPLLNAGASPYSQSLSSYDMAELFVWAPTAGGLTLSFDTGRPWGVGQSVKVLNRGTQPFNVTNTGTTIAPGNKVEFCHLGGGAFAAYV